MIRPRRAIVLAAMLLAFAVLPIPGAIMGMITGPILGPIAAAAEPGEESGDPLQVSIDDITPATLPNRPGQSITVTGVVTNTSDQTWTDLQAYLLTSYSPMRTTAEVTEALQSAQDAYIGNRLAQVGQFSEVGDLKPGESLRYEVRVKRSDLQISGEAGVYWLGVQVLGTVDGVREDGADGRARALMTLIHGSGPDAPQPVRLSVVLPLRAQIAFDATGRPAQPRRWERALSPQGRLGRLLTAADGSGLLQGGFPISYLVDPALVATASTLAQGSPGFDLAAGRPDDEPEPSPSPDEGPDKSPGESPLENPVPSGTTDLSGDGDAESAEATLRAADDTAASAAEIAADAKGNATAWLDLLTDLSSSGEVLALPYGDVDVEGAYQAEFGELVAQASERGVQVLADHDIESIPVLAPTEGSLTGLTTTASARVAPVLMAADQVETTGSRVNTAAGAQITLTDQSLALPVSKDQLTTLAVRQRVLATAAVRALDDAANGPLVMMLPNYWNPPATQGPTELLAGLDEVDWISGIPAGEVVNSPVTDDTIGSAALPEQSAANGGVLPRANYQSTVSLQEDATSFDVTLQHGGAVAEQFIDLSYLGIATTARNQPQLAQQRTESLRHTIGSELSGIEISGPSFVTLSGENGPFQVTVYNGLTEAISIGIKAETGTAPVTIDAHEPVRILAGQRRTLRMHAASDTIGVWPIVLRAVNDNGATVGDAETFRLRSSNVGQLIWLVLGLGSAGLLVAIVLRTRGKVRERFGSGSRTDTESSPDPTTDDTGVGHQ